MLKRDSALIATIIGILKAGCTFVPLDLEYPVERIQYIYENSQADYIISEDESTEVSLNIEELLKEENTENPNVEISPDDLAYMIYTSGSTGKPKGVMIGHENACNQVAENPKAEYNNLLSIATIAFDTSLEDILTGITNGIKIIFANDNEIKNVVDLINLIDENKPEVMEFTPSRLISQTIHRRKSIQQLRTNRSNNSIQLQRNNRPRKHHSWTCTQKLRNRS